MTYRLAPTKQFMKMLKSQPQNLEKQIKKTLQLLQENPAHPSLRCKKYQSIDGVWEASINMKYRILWQYGIEQPNVIVLLAIGDHSIL
ncbi:MAG: type II toxin-antitoxin system mRNA interferase toxin, RelE/StbE family [Bacillota bacterium]|nr:type II toxin-antitoxin system mRNA interferase toxin, RelE/StbE family [Bacillota bacterium]MDW7729940.1 type II toxin-antitoxin system mRNA interferase toxin, RelE/StbE family [Bacillota bacterium]